MPSTTSLTIGDAIADTLRLLYREAERPLQVVLGSNALSSSSDAELTLASDTDWDAVGVGDRLELGTEIMLVTAKSADATPVYTVSRAQYDTPNHGTAATGDSLIVNPTWSRWDVWRLMERFMAGTLPSLLPFRSTQSVYRTEDKGWCELAENTLDVLDVFLVSETSGRRSYWDQWDFEPDMPTSLVTSGHALIVPPWIPDTQLLHVIYQSPYQWYDGATDAALSPNAPVDEADYVKLLHGSDDLPSLYAFAFLITGRELSRMEVEEIEEWTQEAAIRQGVNLRMVQQLWTQFYRRVAELENVHGRARPRRFRRRVKAPWSVLKGEL